MLVFATETSCDETSICLMKDKEILLHKVYSQEIHKKFGGVVPELASRAHLEILQNMTSEIFKKNEPNYKNIDLFAATCGPGLIGSLLVGATFTKALALGFNRPFVPINHLEGHVLSTSFNNSIKYPHLVLLLTGGHTQIYFMDNSNKIKLIAESVDDALGEVFDKTAKLLGLEYPGGIEIENRAKNGNENAFNLPKPLVKKDNLNFSFSGIKTHINLLTKNNDINDNFINDIAASFQKCVSEILISKIESCLKTYSNKNNKIKSISVVGGVANNKYIKKKLEDFLYNKEIEIYYPIKEMMSDNAAMIAWACLNNYNSKRNNLFFKPEPRLKINELLVN
tara:strand:+ start:833 stop:1849 length:1017 start_codon:yes stop_codon:yes gene_type:complete